MNFRSKLILIVLLLSLLVSLFAFGGAAIAAEQQQQAQFVAPILVANTSFLNIRTGPGAQYTVLVTVTGGTELPVLGVANDQVWYLVSTVAGVGWVNLEFTLPRGDFRNVPLVDFNDENIPLVIAYPTPATVALPSGQGGGSAQVVIVPSTTTVQQGAAPVIVVPAGQGGGVPVVTAPVTTTTTVFATEEAGPLNTTRAALIVQSTNVKRDPSIDSGAVGNIFRDDAKDYAVLGRVLDSGSIPWVKLFVPGMGEGWVEEGKITYRLSGALGSVVIIDSENVALLDSPNGSNRGLPLLQRGIEGYLRNISPDGQFIQLELLGGLTGWVPTQLTIARTGTPTDGLFQIYKDSGIVIPPAAPAATTTTTVVVQPVTTNTTSGVIIAAQTVPQGVVLATPVPVITTGAALEGAIVIVNTSFLNVRSGPGAQYTEVTTLRGGTELPVLGVTGDNVWFLVRGDFGQGWVNSEFVIFRGNRDNVPVIPNAYEIGGELTIPTAAVPAAITLYAAPGTNFGVVGTLLGPTEVQIVARTANFEWVQLNTSLGFGWVPASQIFVRGDATLIPIVG